jgi:hypothetical protein
MNTDETGKSGNFETRTTMRMMVWDSGKPVGIMECGAKRSATPLSSGSRFSEVA